MLAMLCLILLASPFSVEPARDSAIVQMKHGRWSDAYENVKIVLVHRPEDLFSLGLLKFAESKGLVTSMNRKFVSLLAHSTDKIINFWEELRSADPLNVNILQVLAALYIGNDLAKGRLRANRAIELDPTNAHGYLFRGHIEMKAGNYEEAINDYRHAYGLDTTLTSAPAMLANIFLLQNNLDNVIRYLSMISYTDPKYSELHVYEVLCHLKLGELPKAETLLHKAKRDIVKMEIALNLSYIENYVDRLKTNSLTKQDTFVILTAAASELVGLPHSRQVNVKVFPTIWPAAVLTVNGIEFIYRTDQFTELELIELPRPRYPEDLRRSGIEGSVKIFALVDTSGSIMLAEVSASSGYEDFDGAALEVVKMAKLKPARLFGVPIRTWILFPINFKLLR